MHLFFDHFAFALTGLILLALCLTCLRAFMKQALSLRGNRNSCIEFEHRFAQSKDLSTAEMQARGADCDMAEVACAGFDAYADYRQFPSSVSFYGSLLKLMDRPMRLSIRKVLQQQERRLMLFTGVAALAPVVGISGALVGIAIVPTQDAMVAGLASMALGLSISVMAILIYKWSLNHQRRRAVELETFVDEFLRVLSHHSTHQRY
jgi:biopolymer transport protein ExbB/TolQ